MCLQNCEDNFVMDFVQIKQEILDGDPPIKQEKPGNFTLVLPIDEEPLEETQCDEDLFEEVEPKGKLKFPQKQKQNKFA